jgi:type II secretion system protein N
LIFSSNSGWVTFRVRKFGRIILFVVGGLSILAAVILLGLNLYVESQGTQARIQQELRQRLGTALHIGRISVTPWGGLKLSGITIPETSEGGAANFLEANRFVLRVRIWSLFSQRLVIRDVSLVDPKVVWPQNADGKWRLPGALQNEPHHATERPAALAAVPSPTTAAEASSPSASALETSIAPSTKVNQVFVPEVRRVSLIRGNFRFLDRAGNLVAAFENIGFRSSLRNGVALRGAARIEKISLRDRFYLEQLRSPLRYEPGELEFSQISAHAAGGDLLGHFSMQPQTEDSPFNVEVKFRNLQADRIVTEAGGPQGVLSGKLEGSLQASGKTADANALVGSGAIFLREGQVRQYSLLAALGQMLQIEELAQLHLDQAEAKYHISPGVITVDELILRSPNIRLSATGTISLGGKLHLNSRLAIDEKIRAHLFKSMRTNFQPMEEPGYFAVDFQVGGTIERPKSNLFEKVVGRDLKDLVNSFLGGKSERPKKKKSPETAPATEGTETATTPAGPP